MGNIIQHLRGSVVDHSTYTGKKGEISLVTDASEARIPTGEIRIHDDSTPGGLPIVLGTTTNPLTSNIVLGSGVGINFHNYGTGVDSNLLDDYEEGTWAGAISGVTSIGNTTSGYTKIGRTVIVTSHLSISGSLPDTFSITGLPFTSSSSFRGSVSITLQDSSNSYAQVSGPTATIGDSSSHIGVDLHGFTFSFDRINLTCVYYT